MWKISHTVKYPSDRKARIKWSKILRFQIVEWNINFQPVKLPILSRFPTFLPLCKTLVTPNHLFWSIFTRYIKLLLHHEDFPFHFVVLAFGNNRQVGFKRESDRISALSRDFFPNSILCQAEFLTLGMYNKPNNHFQREPQIDFSHFSRLFLLS